MNLFLFSRDGELCLATTEVTTDSHMLTIWTSITEVSLSHFLSLSHSSLSLSLSLSLPLSLTPSLSHPLSLSLLSFLSCSAAVITLIKGSRSAVLADTSTTLCITHRDG